jgi:hypothetical protein
MSAPSTHPTVCSSLSGPFCLHLGADAAFKPYMTPIDEPSDSGATRLGEMAKAGALASAPKKCFFRHFSRTWMDAGNEANDIMSQRVKSSDECEALCCAHPKCNSYTFWAGHTCFLRATGNVPRKDADSFSANKLK